MINVKARHPAGFLFVAILLIAALVSSLNAKQGSEYLSDPSFRDIHKKAPHERGLFVLHFRGAAYPSKNRGQSTFPIHRSGEFLRNARVLLAVSKPMDNGPFRYLMVSGERLMPRARRLDVPGVAQHVIQRGNDRQACFFREIDYVRYLQDLREAATRYGCRIHAYVLMTNHVHLLVTPAEAGAIARTMQAVGRRYVRYINDSVCRTGTLWEGRYKSSLVDSERYVLACYRYIELNPVRAGMVDGPDGYRWSSYRANAMCGHDPLVVPHEAYQRIGLDTVGRCGCYRELVSQGIADDELATIRQYAQRQRALGSTRFQDQIERMLQRRAGIGKPGRPRKKSVVAEKVL